MSAQLIKTVGIEYDEAGIRAVRSEVSVRKAGIEHSIVAAEELRGNFVTDEDLTHGLSTMRSKLPVHASDHIVTCLSGKQIHVARMPFRQLPDDEMRSALRFEMRKVLPFDVAGSAIEYQRMPGPADGPNFFVAASGAALFSRHIGVLDKAGLRPAIVDVLPAAIANAYWSWAPAAAADGSAVILMHCSPSLCTMVFDGAGPQFFCRLIPLSTPETPHPAAAVGVNDHAKKENSLSILRDEVQRTIAYYENIYKPRQFVGLCLMGGDMLDDKTPAFFGDFLGMPVGFNRLPEKLGGKDIPKNARFDIALALAMRIR